MGKTLEGREHQETEQMTLGLEGTGQVEVALSGDWRNCKGREIWG
jgi:hypothetical protein